jgi:hypothetical protein
MLSFSVLRYAGLVCWVSCWVLYAQAQSLIVDALVTPPLCGSAPNGSIQITVSGGVPPYSYEWSTGETDAALFGLAPGTYFCTVLDAAGNSNAISATVPVGPTVSLQLVESVPVSCGGLNPGSLVVQATGGSGIYTYALCGSLSSNTSGAFNNLSVGSYCIEATDQNGCLATASFSVGGSTEPFTAQVIRVSPVTCAGAQNGEIQLSVSGGVAPYQLTTDLGLTFTPGLTLTGLAPGLVSVYVQDANGCVSNVFEVTITEPAPLAFSQASYTVTACEGDALTLAAGVTGGTGGRTFNWFPGTGLVNATAAEPVFAGSETQTYTVTVTDVNGCTATAGYTVSIAQARYFVGSARLNPGGVYVRIRTSDSTTVLADTSRAALVLPGGAPEAARLLYLRTEVPDSIPHTYYSAESLPIHVIQWATPVGVAGCVPPQFLPATTFTAPNFESPFPLTSLLAGRVTALPNGQGGGLAGLKILAVDVSTNNSAIRAGVTDAQGNFRIQVPQGRYELWIDRPFFEPRIQDRRFTLGPGESRTGLLLHRVGNTLVYDAATARAEPDAAPSWCTAYPNPTTGSLWLNLQDGATIREIALVSAAGKIHRLPLPVDGKVELSAYPAGVYGLQLTDTQGRTATVRVVMTP